MRTISDNDLYKCELSKVFWILSTISFDMKKFKKEKDVEMCPVLFGYCIIWTSSATSTNQIYYLKCREHTGFSVRM